MITKQSNFVKFEYGWVDKISLIRKVGTPQMFRGLYLNLNRIYLYYISPNFLFYFNAYSNSIFKTVKTIGVLQTANLPKYNHFK